MKIIKISFYSFMVIIIFLIALYNILLYWENHQTSYLEMKNLPELSENSHIITNVNIVPMTGDTVLFNKTVIIRNGYITNIADTILSDGHHVINGEGGYITPGLIDMHVHLWDNFELGLYLANGVTTVRSLLGMPYHLKVKKAIHENILIGPLFYTSSPQFSGPDEHDILKKAIKSPTEARELVIKYKKQGYDFIKTYNLLPKPTFDAILEQSSASQIPVVAHPSFKVNYEYHFNPIISTVEHTEDIFQQALNYSFNRNKLDSIIAGYAESGQTHCPTLTVFYNLTRIYNEKEKYLTSWQMNYINPFVRKASGDYERHRARQLKDTSSQTKVNRQHLFHLEIIRKMHLAGVNIVCGTDAGILSTPAGFSIHQELQFYKQAGMSDFQALKTATVNPARIYKEFNMLGTIETNKMANLIFTTQNPLNDISVLQHPEWVMIKGRKINKKVMELFIKKANNRNNFLASMFRILKYAYWGK